MPSAPLAFDAIPIDRPEALDALRGEWETLFRAAAHEPSSSFEWTRAMLGHHVRPEDQVFALRWSRGPAPVAMAVLVARRLHLLRQPVVLLTPLVDEYNTHSDWLVADATPEVAEALVDGLLRLDARWDCFRLSRLLEDHALNPLLRQALERRGVSFTSRRGDASYFLDLPSTYDGYLAERSSKFRNFLRRAERRLADAGSVAVETLEDAADFDSAYDRLLAIERASWKHGHGTAVTAVPRQIGFYREMCRDAMRMGRLHLQWLMLEGHPIAYNMGYLRDGWYYYLKTSFDETHKALHPATVLRARLIAALIDRGIRAFDFPGAPYEWERQWTDTVRWHSVLTVYAGTLRARALSIVERVRHAGPADGDVQHRDPRAQRVQGGG